jgi:CubicO group peptidase (beta-lactamase class C family)
MMRRVILRGLLVLIVLLAGLGLWKRDEIARLNAVNTLFDEERIVANFIHMDALFHTRAMQVRRARPSPLPYAAAPLGLPAGTETWLEDRNATSLLILRRGEIVHEDYRLGTREGDLRISWSVAKSFLAALIGIALDEGAIASINDPVTTYAPDLIGSAYDGATIRNVLNMASGVAFNEDYLDFWSDINRMGRVVALGGSLDDFAAGLSDKRAVPGAEWHYVSIDTHVLGMVLRGATGQSVPELMEKKLLGPLGLEADPYYVTDGEGTAFVLGGLNMTTRDFARFGQMILQGGMWQGRQMVQASWVDAMTAESAPWQTGQIARYGYQWWLPNDARPGEVFAIGVYGQYIWIDRDRGVVIVMTSADRGFEEPGVFEANIEMFRNLVEAVQ